MPTMSVEQYCQSWIMEFTALMMPPNSSLYRDSVIVLRHKRIANRYCAALKGGNSRQLALKVCS